MIFSDKYTMIFLYYSYPYMLSSNISYDMLKYNNHLFVGQMYFSFTLTYVCTILIRLLSIHNFLTML